MTGFEVVGRWLFRSRSWTPIPVLALLIYSARPSPFSLGLGSVLIAAGQTVRLWAIRHIGPESRSRSDGPQKLATTGPYAFFSHPLYMGNIAITLGVVMATGGPRWVWLLILLLASVQYLFIASYERWWLTERFGSVYTEHRRTVSWRSRPQMRRNAQTSAPTAHSAPDLPHIAHREAGKSAIWSWRDAIVSERRTLQGLAAMAVLLFLLGR